MMYNGIIQRLPHNKKTQHTTTTTTTTGGTNNNNNNISNIRVVHHYINGNGVTNNNSTSQYLPQHMNDTTNNSILVDEFENHNRLRTNGTNGSKQLLRYPLQYCCCTSFIRKIILVTPFLLLIILVCVYIGQRVLSFHFENIDWDHPSYHFLERTCSLPNYYTYADFDSDSTSTSASTSLRNGDGVTSITASTKPKICITTLTDESNKSLINKILGWRNFDGILELTWDNKFQYAQKHSYTVYDESHVVNGTRGPSWFKIIAVQRLLREEQCDWVFWMDADMVIMNSTIRIEDFLPYYYDHDDLLSIPSDAQQPQDRHQQQPLYDLILSMDIRGSSVSSTDGTTQIINGTRHVSNTGVYNAGAWIIRNSEWSMEFLTRWWNMKSYVEPIGHSFSGDNHALKDLLRNVSNFDAHCLVPPRCTFNSFAKFVRDTMDASKRQQILTDRTYNEAFYHKGDFVAHVAGVDNKRDTIKMLLELAE